MTAVAEPKKRARKKAAAVVHVSSNGTPKPQTDWEAEYPGEDFLVFTAKDGTTVGLAAPSGQRKLKPGDFRLMSHMEGWQQTFYMIEKVASPKALAISDDFDDQDYADMMNAWTKWSGTTTGES